MILFFILLFLTNCQKQTLLQLKQSLDPDSISPCLTSWNNSNPITSFQNIILDGSNQVISIQLSRCSLMGSLIPFTLDTLEELHLDANSITGEIPNFNLSACTFLGLNDNLLSGTVPLLENVPNLVHLDFSTNHLTGSVPPFTHPNMTFLKIVVNHLDGVIHQFSLPKLATFWLGDNYLTGHMPSFKNSPLLSILDVGGNLLTGPCPPLLNNHEITDYTIDTNHFTGHLPLFESHPMLYQMNVFSTRVSGNIPSYDLPGLHKMDIHGNFLVGSLPTDWKLPLVNYLDASQNLLSGTLEDSSFQMDSLQTLFLSGNNFTGSFPQFASAPLLQDVNAGGNFFSGPLPDLSHTNLLYLYIQNNQLRGPFPKLPTSIIAAKLSSNHLYGTLPSFSLYPSLERFHISNNLFHGPLPDFKGAPNLETIDLAYNLFDQEFPHLQNEKLQSIYLNNNKFHGPFPKFNNSLSLQNCFINWNNFSGKLEIASQDLETLHFAHNLFDEIQDFSMYTKLIEFDCSHNNFTTFSMEFLPDTLHILYMGYNSFSFDTLTSYARFDKLVRLDVSGLSLAFLPYFPSVQYYTARDNAFVTYNVFENGTFHSSDFGSIFYLDFSQNGFVENIISSFPTQQITFVNISNTATTLSLETITAWNFLETLDFTDSGVHFTPTQIYHSPTITVVTDQKQHTNFAKNYFCLSIYFNNLPNMDLHLNYEQIDYATCGCLSGHYGTPPNCLPCPKGEFNCLFDETTSSQPLPNTSFHLPNPTANSYLELVEHAPIQPTGFDSLPPVVNFTSVSSDASPLYGQTMLCPSISSRGTTHTSACIQSDGALNGINNCLDGYTGRACSACKSDYYSSASQCAQCNSAFTIVYFVIQSLFATIGVLFAIRYVYRSEKKRWTTFSKGNCLFSEFAESHTTELDSALLGTSGSTLDFLSTNSHVSGRDSRSGPEQPTSYQEYEDYQPIEAPKKPRNLLPLLFYLFFFVQTISAVPHFGFRFPSFTWNFYQVFNSAFSLNFLHTQCLFPSSSDSVDSAISSFRMVFFFWATIPVALFVGCFIFWMIRKNHIHFPVLVRVFTYLLSLIYFPYTQTISKPLGFNISPLGTHYLSSALYYNFDPSSSSVDQSIQILSILGTVFITVGTPLILTFFYLYNNSSFSQFVVYPFIENYQYSGFIFADLVLRLVFVCLTSLVSSTNPSRPIFFTTALLLFKTVHANLKPEKDFHLQIANGYSVISGYVLILSVAQMEDMSHPVTNEFVFTFFHILGIGFVLGYQLWILNFFAPKVKTKLKSTFSYLF